MAGIAAVFKNREQQRLRAGWRILLFALMFWLLAAVVFAIKPLLGDITKREFVEDYSLLIVAVLAVAATISVFLARRGLDKRSFRSLGLHWSRQAALDLGFGFLLSGLMAGAFLVTVVMIGVVEIEQVGFVSLDEAIAASGDFVSFMALFSVVAMLVLLLEHTLVGYWEELVFRGYLLQNMRDGMGLMAAVIVSCLIYGLVHAGNPNATWLSTLIIVSFGFLRIYGYLVTGLLWLSIGMHIGWNFFQGPIFGFAASGHAKAHLVTLSVSEPSWLSGGTFGPEGSVLVIPIVLLALLAMRAWGRRFYSVEDTQVNADQGP